MKPLAVLIILILAGCSQPPSVCIGKDCFDVELANSPAQRRQGLMDRTDLPDHSGMLFIFDHAAHHQFWMKNTLIPLDIIWINDSSHIVHIHEHTPPCSADPCPTYGPSTPATYVLEINGGLAAQKGFTAGDSILFKNIHTRP